MNASSTAFAVDPEDLRIPDDLPPPSQDQGEVVALLAEERARGEGWSARVAVQLARRWGSEGFRVFLGDGDFSEAPLHGMLGVPNTEGLSDVIVHGASPGRVAQRVEGSGMLFASAGTIVADASEVYAHPRWSAIFSAFRESGSVFLLYLPSEAATPELIALCDRVIRLADAPPGAGEAVDGIVLHAAVRGRDADTPDSTPSESSRASSLGVAAGEEDAEAASGPTEATIEVAASSDLEPIEAGVTEAGVAGAEHTEASAPDKASRPDEPSWLETAKRVKPDPSRRSRLVLLAVVLILLALAVLGEWLGYFDLPGLAAWLDAGASGPLVAPANIYG